MLLGTEQFYGVGTIRLERVKGISAAIRAVVAVAVIQPVAIVVKGDHPAIRLDGHQPAVDLGPGLVAKATNDAHAQGDVTQNLIGLAGCKRLWGQNEICLCRSEFAEWYMNVAGKAWVTALNPVAGDHENCQVDG